jgi:hypothetical protein
MAASRQQRTSITPELVEETDAALREERDDLAPVDEASDGTQFQSIAPPASAGLAPAREVAAELEVGGDETSITEVVLSKPVFLPARKTYEFVPKIRHAIAGLGWLAIAIPAVVAAALVSWPAQQRNVLSSLLGNSPGVSGLDSTSNVVATEIARAVDPLALLKIPAAKPSLNPSNEMAMSREALVAALRGVSRTKLARDDARSGSQSAMVATRHRAERTTLTAAKNESRRDADSRKKGEAARVTRGKKGDEQRSPAQQLTSRTQP